MPTSCSSRWPPRLSAVGVALFRGSLSRPKRQPLDFAQACLVDIGFASIARGAPYSVQQTRASTLIRGPLTDKEYQPVFGALQRFLGSAFDSFLIKPPPGSRYGVTSTMGPTPKRRRDEPEVRRQSHATSAVTASEPVGESPG